MPEGLITIDSQFDALTSLERLEQAIAANGMTLFARIDHAEGARRAELFLPPTVILLFGNSKVGSPLMQKNRAIGLDLPLKLLVWEDDTGITHVTYNDADWLAARHSISESAMPNIRKLKTVFQKVLNSITTDNHGL